MHFRHRPIPLLCGMAFMCFLACHRSVTGNAPSLLARFPALSPADTLHAEIAQESEAPATGDTLSNALFFSALPPALLQNIDHIADSATAVVLARAHFPLTARVEACWVDIHQFWFKHQSLFLYDKEKQTFTSQVTLAEWYGGDGGQLLTGSWLFDYDGDGARDIIRQEIEHSLVPEGDTVLEHTHASATLLLWKDGRFVETPLKDTAAVMARYPIKSPW